MGALLRDSLVGIGLAKELRGRLAKALAEEFGEMLRRLKSAFKGDLFNRKYSSQQIATGAWGCPS